MHVPRRLGKIHVVDKEGESMNPVIAIAHWPGKDVPVCAVHLQKIKDVGAAMGIVVSVSYTLYSGDDLTCKNCENEAKANG